MDQSSYDSPTNVDDTDADAHDPGKDLADFLRSRRYAKYIRSSRLMRQNESRSEPHHVNALGMAFNIYF